MEEKAEGGGSGGGAGGTGPVPDGGPAVHVPSRIPFFILLALASLLVLEVYDDRHTFAVGSLHSRAGGLTTAAHVRRPASNASSSTAGTLPNEPLTLPYLRPGEPVLIVATNAVGRFSNQRAAFVEQLTVAIHTGRALLHPGLQFCKGEFKETIGDLFDLTVLRRIARLFEYTRGQGDFSGHCGPAPPGSDGWPIFGTDFTINVGGGFVEPYAPAADGSVAGIVWQRIVPSTAALDLPIPRLREPNAGAYGKRYPYAQYINALPGPWETSVRPGALDALRTRSEAHEERCVGIWGLFFHIDWGQVPDVWESIERHLVPSPPIRAAVIAFMARTGLSREPFVAVHVRIADVTDYPSAMTKCHQGDKSVADWVGAQMDTLGAGLLAIASDNFGSPCVAGLTARFPRHVFVASDVFSPVTCSEAVFVQEVLGHSVAFIGSAVSTFTAAISSVRGRVFGFDKAWQTSFAI